MIGPPDETEPAVVVEGDCLDVLPALADGSADAVVTDPPYGLEFMGKEWDRGVPGAPFWAAALRVLRPGGYMLTMGGTRTYHRLACAVEDAGFQVRDCLMWLYGTGFPKGKGCLKPAWEPILLARKPGPKVLPLGIDACRIPTTDKLGGGAESQTRADQKGNDGWVRPWMSDPEAQAAHAARVRENVAKAESLGRWPANVVQDGSDEVLEAFAAFGERKAGGSINNRKPFDRWREMEGCEDQPEHAGSSTSFNDTGTAARFFYCAKATQAERGDFNRHPTVKPLALMRWLVRLVCPPGGLVLDPFAGSGSTGVAALAEGRRFVGVEREPEYAEIARRRLSEARAVPPLGAGDW